ncbi:hypothetical protein CXB51_005563 [Gossypium anomalum]|uniref:Uncharacterized protein n=1 Tax=Gossypium anomalum TaxID=47600 RepID=A0A8J6D822_9ROSI|nr:hypothetical protein CXB51_005563 [Gossypium anomalum]
MSILIQVVLCQVILMPNPLGVVIMIYKRVNGSRRASNMILLKEGSSKIPLIKVNKWKRMMRPPMMMVLDMSPLLLYAHMRFLSLFEPPLMTFMLILMLI